MSRHVYNCHTLENSLKLLALWTAVALSGLAHVWVDGYFRRVGIVAPLVNGKSLPKAAADAFLNMTHLWTLTPAAPSLSQWLFLRLETEREDLQYRFLKGFQIIHGRADWKDVLISQRDGGADLGVPGRWIAIPSYLSHYREFLHDVESNQPKQPAVPATDALADIDDGFLSPHVRQQVENEIRAGRKIQAIALVRLHTRVGLKEAKDYVEQLSLETGGMAEGARPYTSATKLQRANSLGCSVALFVFQLLLMIYL